MTREESGYELVQPWVSIQHRSSLGIRDSSGADLQYQSFVYQIALNQGAAGREKAGNQPYAGTKNRAPHGVRVVTIQLVRACLIFLRQQVSPAREQNSSRRRASETQKGLFAFSSKRDFLKHSAQSIVAE
jgi:hypothetical protein